MRTAAVCVMAATAMLTGTSHAGISAACVLNPTGGWQQYCEEPPVAPGVGTLTLTLFTHSSGFAMVVCDANGHGRADIVEIEQGPGTYSTQYYRDGTCELVAGGTGSGRATAT